MATFEYGLLQSTRSLQTQRKRAMCAVLNKIKYHKYQMKYIIQFNSSIAPGEGEGATHWQLSFSCKTKDLSEQLTWLNLIGIELSTQRATQRQHVVPPPLLPPAVQSVLVLPFPTAHVCICCRCRCCCCC